MTRGSRNFSGLPARTNRKTIVVADLVGKKTGDNPHIWYDPRTMPALAKALADTLSSEDPAHKAEYEKRLAQFDESMKPIQAKIDELRGRLAGVPVTATEPVFGYMFQALGMTDRNQSFQLAVMNDTEPSASDIAAFENDLKTHRVKLLDLQQPGHGPDRQADAADCRGVGGACRRGYRDRTRRRDLSELDDRRTHRGRSRAPKAGPVNA